MSADHERYLGWRDVQPLFGGISRTTVWRGVRAGWLPAPVRVSPGRRVWRASDISAWQAALSRSAPERTGAGPPRRTRNSVSRGPPPD